MAKQLTPRERLKLTLAHKQPDRPPIRIDYTKEVQTVLSAYFKEKFGDEDIARILNIDFRYVSPQRIKVQKQKEETALLHGMYQDVTLKPLAWIKTMDDVCKFQPAINPDEFNYQNIGNMCAANDPFIRTLGDPGQFDIVNGLGARGIGLEDMICAIMTEDPVVVALIDKHLANNYEFLRRCLEAGGGMIEIVHIGEDCGNQRSPLFPPEFFKRFFAPRMKRFADLAHNFGAACMLHSCGSVRDILNILIKDVGIDIHDACQPEPSGMAPAGLKRDFGGRITFCGMLSLQKTLPYGTPEDCRKEAEFLIKEAGKKGGYIFSPPNTITNDVPLENILAIYEAVTGKDLRQPVR